MATAPTRVSGRRVIEYGENQASLRAIMTAPAMSAAAHAAIARQRTAARRRAEDARDSRALATDEWSSR